MKNYKHIWPKISEATIKAVVNQLRKGEISIYNRSGIFEEFEKKFAKEIGSKYALLVNSGTSGLHSAMVGCDFQPGDEVICPAYTFYATVTPIFQTGAVPILCDAGQDGNIDPEKIEGLISKKTKAIIVTHMWGMPCDMDKIVKIAKKHRLFLIEDCSHAHGAKYKGGVIGSMGDVAAFSLQGQKIVTGGEGGILVTNNKEIYDRALLLGHYNKRSKQEISKKSKYYDYAITGFGLKFRAHPFAVAMANEQFSHLHKWHKIMQKNAKYLTEQLGKVGEAIILPETKNSNDEPAWYAYTIGIKEGSINISVDEFVEQLNLRGIKDADKPGSTCPLNYLKLFQKPERLFPAYKGKIKYKKGDFPVAEKFYNQTFKLPIDVQDSKEYRKVLDEYATVINQTLSDYSRT